MNVLLMASFFSLLVSYFNLSAMEADSHEGMNFNSAKSNYFLHLLEDWSKDRLPFVLDTDREKQVWNLPYDRVRVSESSQAPNGFDASNLPNDGSVTYYHIVMSGAGYYDKQRIYEFYVQRDGFGNVVSQGWINTPYTHN